MKITSLLLLVMFALSSCGRQTDPIRDVIAFPDGTSQVADSVRRLEEVIKKLPPHPALGSFVDNDGYWHVNAEKVGLLKKALYKSTIRNNPVFDGFSNRDYERFVSVTKFLLKNHIDGSMRDNASGFIHEYRSTIIHEFDDLRYLILDADTTLQNFISTYKVLDRKNNLILVVPINKMLK